MRIRHFHPIRRASLFDPPDGNQCKRERTHGIKGRVPLLNRFFAASPSGAFQYSVVWLKKAGIPGRGNPIGECPRGGNQRQPIRKNPAAKMQEQAQNRAKLFEEAGNKILWQHKSNRQR
jgi:hypothetical protein